MPECVAGYTYPTTVELRQLQQELMPRFAEGRLAFQLFPFRETEFPYIVSNKPDIFRGMTGHRGLDKPTTQVTDKFNYFGQNRPIEPGYWGEHDFVTEEFLTRAAKGGTLNDPVDITEHVTTMQRRLTERMFNRLEYSIWNAMLFGIYEAYNSMNQLMLRESFNIQQVTSLVPWSDQVNSRPLADLRCIQLKGRGTSTTFNDEARMLMTRVTLNCLLSNRNPADLGKLNTAACCEPISQDKVNAAFVAQGLPKAEVYDEGWVDEAGNFHTYIPDGRVLILGKRPGNVPLGNWWYTRNVLNGMVNTGPWVMIRDTVNFQEVPRRIQVLNGFNGGVMIDYARGVISMDVGCSGDCP